MVFVFEVLNRLETHLSLGLPNAGPEWGKNLRPGEMRILRASKDSLLDIIAYLDLAYQKGQISVTIKTELEFEKAKYLKDLDSLALRESLEEISRSRKMGGSISFQRGDNYLEKLTNWVLNHRIIAIITLVFIIASTLLVTVKDFRDIFSNQTNEGASLPNTLHNQNPDTLAKPQTENLEQVASQDSVYFNNDPEKPPDLVATSPENDSLLAVREFPVANWHTLKMQLNERLRRSKDIIVLINGEDAISGRNLDILTLKVSVTEKSQQIEVIKDGESVCVESMIISEATEYINPCM